MTDRVEVGITHQVRIGREDSWIKLSVALDRTDNETIDDAIYRASSIANQRVLNIVEQTVKSVQDFERKN